MVKKEKGLKSLRTNVRRDQELIDTRIKRKIILFFFCKKKTFFENEALFNNTFLQIKNLCEIINLFIRYKLIYKLKPIRSENRINY